MTNRAAGTAVGPMVIAAVEQHHRPQERLLHDDMAVRLLPAGMRWVVGLTRWRAVRELLIKFSEKNAPGIWGAIACRKRYIDDALVDALRAGVDSVVVLGAGLDTRAYRLAVPARIPVFEVDLPVNIDAKRKRIELPHTVTLVPIDFEHEDLESVLAAHGCRTGAVTAFVWEGVTQYLTEAGVRATFGFLTKAGRGSRLVFTYERKDFLNGTTMYGAEVLYRRFVEKQRLWKFGMDPGDVARFLAEYGWRELEQVGAEELTTRYVRPAGRVVPVSELERSVHAEKT